MRKENAGCDVCADALSTQKKGMRNALKLTYCIKGTLPKQEDPKALHIFGWIRIVLEERR